MSLPYEPTEELCLNDTHVFSCEATVLHVTEIELILNRTVFYAQGGGQPSDNGNIYMGEEYKFVVEAVKKETSATKVDGHVYVHFGKWVDKNGVVTGPNVSVGDVVKVEIDGKMRVLNARLHSGGHLMDSVIKEMFPKLSPGKGYHYPAGAYVEYVGDMGDNKDPQLVSKIQAEVDKLIGADIPVEVYSDCTDDKIMELCGCVPSYVAGKSHVRVVRITQSSSCPCGGTHVASTKEIGPMVIKNVKKKGSKTVRVHYEMQ